MSFSQNVRFSGEAPKDNEFSHPEGFSIARLLSTKLAERNWTADEIENWRDVGWSLNCGRDAVKLQLALSTIGNGEWMLQVAPSHSPGIIGRFLGRQASADRSDCLDLARAVHDILQDDDRYGSLMWRWNGLPDSGNSTPEPAA